MLHILSDKNLVLVKNFAKVSLKRLQNFSAHDKRTKNELDKLSDYFRCSSLEKKIFKKLKGF